MNATASTQRTITSSWQGSDLDTSVYTGDDDYAELLEDAITEAGRYASRESYTLEDGVKVVHGFVAEYTDPATGATRYAHYYGDASGTEYTDFATLAEAVAEYEQNVRSLQDCVAGTFDKDGEPARWFETTDVEA